MHDVPPGVQLEKHGNVRLVHLRKQLKHHLIDVGAHFSISQKITVFVDQSPFVPLCEHDKLYHDIPYRNIYADPTGCRFGALSTWRSANHLSLNRSQRSQSFVFVMV